MKSSEIILIERIFRAMGFALLWSVPVYFIGITIIANQTPIYESHVLTEGAPEGDLQSYVLPDSIAQEIVEGGDLHSRWRLTQDEASGHVKAMFTFKKDPDGNCLVMAESENPIDLREILKIWLQVSPDWHTEAALNSGSQAALVKEFKSKNSQYHEDANLLTDMSSTLSDAGHEELRLSWIEAGKELEEIHQRLISLGIDLSSSHRISGEVTQPELKNNLRGSISIATLISFVVFGIALAFRLKKSLTPPTETDVAEFEIRTEKNTPDY